MKLPLLLWVSLLLFVSVSNVVNAQIVAETFEREFDRPVDEIKQALQTLHADESDKLPTLRGFVTDNLNAGRFERPYYQLETELVSKNATQTLLRVKARITAWHTDAGGVSHEYRSLSSNGRLESEFLDRVSSYLVKMDSDLAARISSLEKTLADLRSKTTALDRHCSEVKAANERLEEALRTQTEERTQRTVARSGTRIFEHPTRSARSVLQAERDDIFDVIDHREGWTQVRLGESSTGWLPTAASEPVPRSSEQSALTMALKDKVKPYVITRQAVTPFLGEWPSLKGQKALFLWAQPVGVSRRGAIEKLQYVKQQFADSYRDALHSDGAYSGLVIIFLGSGTKSGVAAARLDDIGQWLDGHMPEPEFLKRCSLDPPEVFRAARR